MQNFEGRVAVITGAASGIGKALAERAAKLGMKLALADFDSDGLTNTGHQLAETGSEVFTATLDVTDSQAMEQFAADTLARFGAAHLLFNNAGVGGGGKLWEVTQREWQWVIGINLNGVFNGIRAFTPALLAAGEGHIVNTASVAGLMSAPGTSSYTVSKHAVVAMSEVLAGDLRGEDADIGVSVLCPSFVNTSIFRSSRYADQLEHSKEQRAEEAAIEEMVGEFFKTAMGPERVAELVFEAIRDGQFYILPHPEGTREQVSKRLQDILDNRSPSVSGPEEFPQA